jgi:hypothetical protein
MVTVRRYGLGAALALSLLGCGDAPQDAPPPDEVRAPFLLFAASAWAPVEASEDPFADRPADARCGPGGTKVEGDAFEVETDLCPYLTATQTTAAALRAGDRVELVVWHLVLTASVAAEAHVAVRIGDALPFERRVPIPSREEIYAEVWTLDAPLPAGSRAWFHLHNHGSNNWNLGRVRVVPVESP